ncbi:hotdog domain-containing protein [Nocardia sp. alder85J]|uniref:hotdog domain-containing protein n=1 Tax=Nocardia sp. alder85J TaxID=2862949 RepID=UPI001CD3A3D1|nr:hotdog domain-containing protein [Nocardia sp. alder85J]MCX4096813.1 PaaI family thioesterase [Nocardia sp. alder85J]
MSSPPLSPYWQSWSDRARTRAAAGWPEMIDGLRALQDEVAATSPPPAVVDAVGALMDQARALLSAHRVDSADQLFGRFFEIPGRGQTLAPPLYIVDAGAHHLTCETTFGPFHSGHAAAHGGAIALFFDEVFGRLVDAGDRPPSRTAYLHLDYRSVTPIDEPVTLHAEIVHEADRKREVAGVLRRGNRICAEGRGLFVALRPDRGRSTA